MRRLLPLLLLLGLLGCRSTPAARDPRPPPGPEVPEPSYYDAPGPVPAPTAVERVWRREHAQLWKVMLPVRIAPSVAHVRGVEEPIEIQFLRARPTGRHRRPLVLAFPILANSELLMFEVGTGVIRMGYDFALVKRREIQFDPVTSIDEAEAEARSLVMRGRQAIDWLVRQPGVDGSRIGLFGISAGGILGAMLVGADPRIDAQVFVLAGGPMADVMVDTTEDRFTRSIAQVMEARGWSREKVRETLRANLRTDPLVLAPRISRENTLMFVASGDESVPTYTQEALWRAIGRPEVVRLWGGHYAGIALGLPTIVGRSQRFLGRRLGTP
jgi:hypothetical protein